LTDKWSRSVGKKFFSSEVTTGAFKTKMAGTGISSNDIHDRSERVLMLGIGGHFHKNRYISHKEISLYKKMLKYILEFKGKAVN
jgi:hypothetical protein